MTVEVVNISTNHLFEGNPIAEQHALRYRAIIERQAWPVPTVNNLEYDQYDNPATTYLIWRDEDHIARGVSRLYPTDRPFMLEEHFTHMITDARLPKGNTVLEGSRFCIDKCLDIGTRTKVAQELVIAYLEHGIKHGIDQYVGIMYPIYWKHLFANIGWIPEWLGAPQVTEDGKKSRAGFVNVSEQILKKVREVTGVTDQVTYYGNNETIGNKELHAA